MMLSPLGARFRERALAQVGKRYIFGYEVRLDDLDPKAFDCSELVQWLYAQCGYRVPDGSYNQYPKTVAVPKGAPLKVGDPYFFIDSRGKVYHVGVYIGNGQCVEARGKAYGVIKTNVPSVKKRGAIFRRFVKDLDGRAIEFETAFDSEQHYWVLAHANGYKANRLIDWCRANTIAVAYKAADREAYKRISEFIQKL